MRIENSNVTLKSAHIYTSEHALTSSLKIGVNISPTSKAPAASLIRQAVQDYLELSKEATKKLNEQSSSSYDLTIKDIDTLNLSEPDKAKLLLVAKMIKSLTGKDLVITMPKTDHITPISINFNSLLTPRLQNIQTNSIAQLNYSETYSESEALAFSADGIVNTSDGKQIKFDLNLSLSQSFTYTNTTSLTLGQRLVDPLVINFNRPSTDITDTHFSFDLDSDGKNESLSTLKAGSGFLAMDLNGNGTIDDGKELFGTSSNNGFEELSKYDSDHNNWIDENDAAFTKLKIWTVKEDGTKELFSLADKGIGAIYLGNVNANFDIHNGSNNLAAKSTAAGIFLREDGTSGTVQQIDYVV